MACNTAIVGILRDCESNFGGVKRLLVANYDDVTAVTLTDGAVSAMTMATGKTFAELYIKPEIASFTSTPQFNDAGDYAGEEGILDAPLHRMDSGKRATVDTMSKNDMRVLFQDGNGKWWLLGYDNPVRRNGGDAATGTARTDTNAYGLQLRSRDNQLPYEVPNTVVEGVLPA